MTGFRDYPRFKSIEEVRIASTGYGCNEMELTYNGKEYFIASEFEDRKNRKRKWKFSIALNHQNDNPIEYNTLDELLDNYKEDGKTIREFILEMEIEFISGVNPGKR
jgi:hypothetical protein